MAHNRHDGKVDFVIVDTSHHLPPKGTLTHALHRACPRTLMIRAEHFDARGALHPQAVEAAAEAMSHGGDVCVDLPDHVRLNPNAFNGFATAVLNRTAAKTDPRAPVHQGQMFFTRPACTLTATPR